MPKSSVDDDREIVPESQQEPDIIELEQSDDQHSLVKQEPSEQTDEGQEEKSIQSDISSLHSLKREIAIGRPEDLLLCLSSPSKFFHLNPMHK